MSALTQLVGRVAQGVGNAYDYATPGGGASTLTNAGNAIVDPNVVYTGNLNPFAGGARSGIHNGGTSGFTPVAQPSQAPNAASDPGSYPDVTLGASTTIPSGGGSTYNPAIYDQATQQAQSSLDRLGNQQNIGTQNILDAYNSAYNTLLGQKAVADRNYQTTKTQTGQDNVAAKNGIDASVGSNASALQRLLGAHGAGSSSAATFLAPWAAAHEGSLQRAGVNQTFARNNQALDTNYGDFNTGYDSSVKDLGHQKDVQQNQLLSGIDTTRASLLQTLASIGSQRATAQGLSPAQVAASAGQYTSQINGLNSNIDSLAKNYANPVLQAAPATYTAPTLDSYAVNPVAGPTVNPSAATDAISPYLSLLLGKDKQKALV